MEPTLCNGDEVMISRVRFQESVREGLYAIRGSSEIFVRRIAIDPTKNGRVRQGGVISAVAVGHRQAALAVMCRG